MSTARSSSSRPAAPPARLPELASYLDSLPEPHVVIDKHYRIVAANTPYRQQFADGATVIGRTCHEVSHHSAVPCDQAGESCPLARARDSGRRERVLHLHHTPQGEVYVDIALVPLRDAQGRGDRYYVEKMEPLRSAHGAAGGDGLIGRAPSFRAMLELAARVGPSRASVLLLGESGTGKELVARAIHEASPRAARPLVVVDCASMPQSLFESELFGHEKGAFTGAHAAKAGLVEAADGGTLFLDEVGDIPLSLQVKLLRLLESGVYRRVGQTELRRADVRLVSATHRDLHAMVADGRFREDLFHRLGTFPITLPALRERREDIPLLADALLARLAPDRRHALSPSALKRLGRHDFPGNVRELRNVLERATLLCDGQTISAGDIERALLLGRPAAATAAGSTAAGSATATAQRPLAATSLREAERGALRAALAAHHGNRQALAHTLGISLRTLYRKLRSLNEPQ